MGYSLRVAEDEPKRLPKTQNPFSGKEKRKEERDARMPHPESHVPRFRERVDTGDQKFPPDPVVVAS
jgi:hypothetical protein